MGVTKFTKVQRNKFLKHYLQFGLMHLAAEAAGVCAETVRNHRKQNPEFDDLVTDALEIFRDTLEMEAVRRAHDGVDTEHYFKGEHTHTETKYSDRLMELLLKRHRHQYRDKVTADVNVKGGMLVLPVVSLNSKDWENGK